MTHSRRDIHTMLVAAAATCVLSTFGGKALAATAEDSSILQRYRRRASDMLARGAASTLGFGSSTDGDDAESLRREAVYAIARSKDRSVDPVPELLDIARSNPHRDARVAALYQLGLLNDPRAVALFENMLKSEK